MLMYLAVISSFLLVMFYIWYYHVGIDGYKAGCSESTTIPGISQYKWLGF
jgi:hypothetical protein